MHPIAADHLLSLAEIETAMRDMASEQPNLVTLSCFGISREGRQIPMITLTDKSVSGHEARPIFLIHGCIHAVELLGAYHALAFAQRLLREHQPGGILERIAFAIIPCINPDGVEFVLSTGGTVVRSRHEQTNRPNTVSQCDMDSDGLILSMVRKEADGPLARDPQEPRLFVPRTPDTPGPFYRMYPEGCVNDWDGGPIRNYDHYIDWNRNFHTNWVNEPIDASGDYPLCESEIRQLTQFVSDHPSIFFGIGLHGGPGTIIAPPGSVAATAIQPADSALLKSFGDIGIQLLKMPYAPSSSYNLPPWCWMNWQGERHGTFVDFMYMSMGIPAFDIELDNTWDLAGLGCLTQKKITSWEEYNAFNRNYLHWTDTQDNPAQYFHDWKPFDHPQLGPVEIGGWDYRYVLYLPEKELQSANNRLGDFLLKCAQHAPQAVWTDIHADYLGADIWRLRATAANLGALPTYLTKQGSTLARFRAAHAEFSPANGVELVSRYRHITLGQLEGYSRHPLEWFVKAPKDCAYFGTITLETAAGRMTCDVGETMKLQ